MRLRLIRVLAVLVAVVLPLQGMATVAAGQCMALGHHQDAGSEAADHAHPAEPDTGHADEAADNGHCGPCTACCATASIAVADRIPLLPAAAEAAYAFRQSSPPGVDSDSLYRPPLSL